MSNANKGQNGKVASPQGGVGLDNKIRCRLASSAITRGQTKALTRYLAEGLDPNSSLPDGWSLTIHALWAGRYECFKILVDAGAHVGVDEISHAIAGMGDDTRALKLLLDLGKFDPAEGPDSRSSWVEFASGYPRALRAKDVLMAAISEKERGALGLVVATSDTKRARASL